MSYDPITKYLMNLIEDNNDVLTNSLNIKVVTIDYVGFLITLINVYQMNPMITIHSYNIVS